MKNIAYLLPVMLLVFQPTIALAQEEFELEEMTAFMLQVPHGVEGKGLAVGGSNLSAYVFFESYYNGNMNVTLEIDLPEGFVLSSHFLFRPSMKTGTGSLIFIFQRICLPEPTI